MRNPAVMLLYVAAVVQLIVAVLNLGLSRMLGWRNDLDRMPRLMREVFQVHTWFLSITLIIFGVLTWRFATEIASGETALHEWLTAGIGVFWAVRVIVQLIYYSPSHWRGKAVPTVVHCILLFVYGWLALLYLGCVFG